MDSSSKFHIYNYFPGLKKYTHSHWDEIGTGKGLDVIGTDGVNNCLVVTLYDPSTKRGSLVHLLNVGRSPIESRPENVIDTMLKAIGLAPDSPNLSSLEATLSGESTRDFVPDIFMSTIVKPILAKYGIPIIGEDLGDITDKTETLLPFLDFDPGRLVFLHCETGNVKVYRA